ncbi:MAG: hypothetical protein NDJ18_01520 [candidate division Zixibacteria bacterium]|nr:hypothetical protein [candidate division Zixibacteria bacterium]
MTRRECEFEMETIRAAREDLWTESLRRHGESCEVCSAARELASAFEELRQQTLAATPPIPDPDLLWLKMALNEPKQQRANVSGIAAAATVVLAVLAYLAFRIWLPRPVASGDSSLSSPFVGAPFPLDATLLFVLIAVALVLFLPGIGSSKYSKRPDQRLITL